MSSPWHKEKLGDLAEVITKGTTPRTLGRDYCTSGVGFVRAENLQGGWVDLKSIDLFIDDETDNLLARSRILVGDVLITIAGTIGRTGVVPSGAGRLNSNQAVALVRLGQRLNPRFLEYWLRTAEAQHQIAGGKVTQNIPNLSLSQIGGLLVPVPELREQARIVELLDQADALRRQRAEADAKLARLLPAFFRHHFGEAMSLAGHQSSMPLECFKIDVRNGFACGDKNVDGGIPHMRMNNISDQGLLDLTLVRTIPQEEDREELRLAKSDVLLMGTNSEEKVGKACVLLTEPDKPTLFSNHLYRLRVSDPRLTGEFLATYLHQLWRAGFLAGRIRRWVNQAALQRENLLSVPVPLIDPARLATFTNQLHQVRGSETQAAASAAKLETLFQTLLHRAFTGELTARWREAHLREGVQEMTRLSRA